MQHGDVSHQPEALLKFADVERLLNLRRRAIETLVATGRLRAIRLSRRAVRFHPEDVREFIERCRTAAA